ncbi:hypothetical protein RND71_011731 [Anisodus tanguticus]|uniref:Uncharacterized protein n=1 Tax=Anisodus tanguticus TaxID=243964 RepID=A0AAE1SEA8_9SOLA|nr:hypothetical protein RND71_011731 [Anisodus tanguticus]
MTLLEKINGARTMNYVPFNCNGRIIEFATKRITQGRLRLFRKQSSCHELNVLSVFTVCFLFSKEESPSVFLCWKRDI